MKGMLFRLVLMSVIPLGMLLAQPTVDLNVPPYIGDVYAWRVNINSDAEYADVRMAGWVEADGTPVYACTTYSFPLHAGKASLTIRSVRIWKQWAAEGYKAFLAYAGQLPGGKYRYGVTLLPFGVGDSDSARVKPMGPPPLLSPRKGEEVTAKYPQFVWGLAPGAVGPVSYGIKLAEMLPDQTPEEALAANKPWYEGKDIRTTSQSYPVSARPLPDAGEFAWQVTVTSDGQVATSEARAFTLSKGSALLGSKGIGEDATIVWQHKNGTNWEIWYARYSAGQLSPPQTLSATPVHNMDPAVTYDRDGNTWCAWSHRGPGASQHYVVVWSSSANGSNNWSGPQPVAMPAALGLEQVDPVIAFDDNGRGICVWVEGDFTNTSNLRASVWNGTSWSQATTLQATTGCFLPEITFTGAPAAGQTPHRAVVIAGLMAIAPDPLNRVGYWTWNGLGWSNCVALPTTGGVVATSYVTYLNASPKPARDHIAISSLTNPIGNQYIVTAAWTRQNTTGAQTKLMACNGYFSSGTWTWHEFANWFTGQDNPLTYHDPSVAVDGSNKSENVFVQSDRVFTKSGFKQCERLVPPSNGRGGSRPAVAWVRPTDPQQRGTLAAWWYGPDINWAFKDANGVWNQPPAIVASGDDLNPDVAARTGSHTMPVQSSASGAGVGSNKTWKDYAAPYQNLAISNKRNPYDYVGIIHNAALDYIRERLPSSQDAATNDTIIALLKDFFELKLRTDKDDTTSYLPAVENLGRNGIHIGSLDEELAALSRDPRLSDTLRFNSLAYLRKIDGLCAAYPESGMGYDGFQNALRKLENEVADKPASASFGKGLVFGEMAITKYSLQYFNENGMNALSESCQRSIRGQDRKGWRHGTRCDGGVINGTVEAGAYSAAEAVSEAWEWLTTW